MKSKRAYILRTCNADMTSRGGFKWPKHGHVEAPDWDPSPRYGGGLRGLLNGEGNGALLSWAKDAAWLVCTTDADAIVNLGGKVKFRRAYVLHCGDRKSATEYLRDKIGASFAIVGSTVSGGDDSTVSGGYCSTVSGGDDSTVSGGDYSTVSGGYCSTVSGGRHSTVSGGYCSTVSGGRHSTVSGGDDSTVSGGRLSTVSGGDYSTVSGGDYSTVSGGYCSTVSGGDYSTVSGGRHSTVSGGYKSVLLAIRLDHEASRRRVEIAYVGEDGIKPNTPYKLDGNGKFVEA